MEACYDAGKIPTVDQPTERGRYGLETNASIGEKYLPYTGDACCGRRGIPAGDACFDRGEARIEHACCDKGAPTVPERHSNG